MPVPRPSPSNRSTGRSAFLLLVSVAVALGGVVAHGVALVVAAAPDHLVVSEIVTGGASASDELVEIHNPTAAPLPLEGLEIVYVSASGATVTRRVAWPVGAPEVPAGGHVLAANDLGAFAPIADALYSGGMAATGGSVAIRIQGAESAIDAVGWGNAASAWMEGTAAPAPAAGESLERLPGGAAGSTVDTDLNATDFAVRAVPDPQNLGSAPTPGSQPSASASPPPPDPTPVPTPTAVASAPVPTPTATPGAASIPIATARGLPDGSTVSVEGVTLTGSNFSDGGGYLADSSGALAVLSDSDTFSRGRHVRATGEIDDRFGQRTLRVASGGIVDLGPATEPEALDAVTGAINETVEGRLVRIEAAISGPASVLTTSIAFDVDDGSGQTRLIIGTGSGIDVGSWTIGTRLAVVGVVGQRDSSGSGAEGYRVQPRDPADVIGVTPPSEPTPAPTSGSPSPGESASASPEPGVMTIAEARAAARNARVRVQGTVTLPTGVVDGGTAVIQDASGAIVVRLSEEAGSVRLGQRIDVSGARSTKSGMETIRVTVPPRSLGAGPEPMPRTLATGAAAEGVEAQLVVVRGGLVASARRASSGTVSMEIDDGSGPLRVVVGSSLALDRSALVEGAWVEVRGVLGQETTGAQPTRGYRVWPRSAGDVRITAGATDAAGGSAGAGDAEGGSSTAEGAGALDDLGALDASTAGAGPVGATLVTGRWTELGLGGLLWDGERLVGLPTSDADRIVATLGGRRPPLALELTGIRSAPGQRGSPVPMATVGTQPDAIRASEKAPVAPATVRPGPGEPARWFAAVGRLEGPPSEPRLSTATGIVPLDRRCGSDERPPRGLVTVIGIALPGSEALLVPCGGIMAGSTLVRPASNDRQSGATGGEEASDASLPSGPVSPAGTLASAMLGAAAFVLAGAAAWLRWRPDEPDPDASDATDGAPADRTAGDASAPPPAQPVLTLVTLPHERSP